MSISNKQNYTQNSQISNFIDAPVENLVINRRGVMRTGIRCHILTSYLEAREGYSPLVIKALDKIATLSLSKHPYRYCLFSRAFVNRRELITVDCPLEKAKKHEKQAIRRFMVEHPRDFKYVVHNREEICMLPTPCDKELKEKIVGLLEYNQISHLTSKKLEYILIGLKQAQNYQKTVPGKIVSISSKSDFLVDINHEARQFNSLSNWSNRHHLGSTSPERSLCSIRVFPDGSSSITIPFEIKLKGGFKTINREIFISPSNEVSLLRRCKILVKHRGSRDCRKYEKNIKRSFKLQSSLVLKPQIVFQEFKKGMQCLLMDCEQDLFSFLENYYNLSNGLMPMNDPRAEKIITTPIEDQIIEVIQMTKGIVEAIKEMHQDGFLHNDIKPENIFLKKTGDSLIPILGDLDMMCSKEEGKSPIHTAGTAGYFDPRVKLRNLQTDFFALAKLILWDSSASLTNNASIMDALNCLKKLSERINPSLALDVKIIILTIRDLCQEISTPSPRTFDDAEIFKYDLILSKLSDCEAHISRSGSRTPFSGVSSPVKFFESPKK